MNINDMNLEDTMKAQDVILGMLMQGPMSGYDIKKQFETVFSYFFDASYGAIYPTLNRMENQGYIVKQVQIQEGKPNKNLYVINEKGKQQFNQYLNSMVEPDVIRSDFCMRMYFGEYVSKAEILTWLEEAREKTKSAIKQLEEDYRCFKPFMTTTQEICIEIGLNHFKSYRETVCQGIKKIMEKAD
jgi:DNA-binding PadR family transcriptional regulator